MYISYFDLDDFPFQLTPNARFFYDSGPHKKALAYLTYALSKGEGFVVITGEIGAGKTTLIDHALSIFKEERIRVQVGRIVNTQLEPAELLKSVAAAFGVEPPFGDKSVVLRNIEARLTANVDDGVASLLFVDEAQNLSESALEELRMLSNCQRGEVPILQIVLVGQPEFRDIMASASMEQLRQRVIVYYHLQSLDQADTRAYIEHRLGIAGWRDDPHLSPPVFRRIHEETLGVPRKINLLCDRLLLFGFLADKHVIEIADLEEVIHDMRSERPEPSPNHHGGPELVFDRSVSHETDPLVEPVSDLDRIIQRVHELEFVIRKQKRVLEATSKKVANFSIGR